VSHARRPFRPARRKPIWTLSRATALGLLAGGAALLLAAFAPSTAEVGLAYFVLLLATLAGAASMLWITAFDVRRRGTRGRMKAIRGFDVAVALGLMIPAAWALSRAWPS